MRLFYIKQQILFLKNKNRRCASLVKRLGSRFKPMKKAYLASHTFIFSNNKSRRLVVVPLFFYIKKHKRCIVCGSRQSFIYWLVFFVIKGCWKTGHSVFFFKKLFLNFFFNLKYLKNIINTLINS